MENGTVNIRGKTYKTVALRVNEFHASKNHAGWAIETDLITDGGNVVMKALIKDSEGRVRGTGYAEEVRGSTNINKTSAIENCETSAIGRALASIGLAGTEYASADEVSEAIVNEKIMEATGWVIPFQNAVREHWDDINEIKTGLQNQDYEIAYTVWHELGKDAQILLWRAPTKGGVFTTEERTLLKNQSEHIKLRDQKKEESNGATTQH